MILTVYVLGLLALALHPPATATPSHAGVAAIVLGALVAWHLGWSLWHSGRALVFTRRRLPALRAAAAALEPGSARPPHLYIVLTDLTGRAETTVRVVQAVLDAAIRCGAPSTLLAGPAEPGRRRLIKQTFLQLAPPEHVRLVFVRWHGARAALGAGLRAVVRARADADAAVMLMTGDTLLPGTAFESCLPFLKLDPRLDLVTVDQTGIGAGGPSAAWLRLKRAERHRTMSSVALTGITDLPDDEPIIVRAGLLTSGGLLELIEREAQSGSDARFEGRQLIWLEGLRQDRAMLYLPDVAVVRVDEHRRGFFTTSSGIVRRQTRRGLLLLRHLSGSAPTAGAGAAIVRLWLIQRLAALTLALLGGLAMVTALAGEPALLVWSVLVVAGVMALLHALGLLVVRPRVHGLWPLLTVYDRLIEAGNLAAAILGRAAAGGRLAGPRPARSRAATGKSGPPRAALLQVLALVALAVVVALTMHLLDLPSLARPASGL